MKRKFLTLEDLYNYFSSTPDSVLFESGEADSEIVVQMPAITEFAEATDAAEELVPVVLKACHTGVNNNQFEISKETMETALTSFINKPILGFIHEVDGVPQFYRHNHHIDENGEIVYDEQPVGVIPESGNPHLEHDDEADVDRVIVNGVLFERYSKAAEILKREQSCSVSVELAIKKMSFDAARKVLTVSDFIFSGVTILGVYPSGDEVKPGMAGSEITLADFSTEKNSLVNMNINQPIGELDTKSSEKGGTAKMADEKILLKEFALSHDDIRFALYRLLEADDDTYVSIVDVYDDYCIYKEWGKEHFYKQGYTKSDEDNTVILSGDPIEVYSEWLTREESDALKQMRENYPVMSEKLAKYEAEPSKMELLNKYNDLLSDNEEFTALTDSHFDLSVDEISSKIDAIILEKAKNQMFESNDKPNKGVTNTKLGTDTPKSSRYGDLFTK